MWVTKALTVPAFMGVVLGQAQAATFYGNVDLAVGAFERNVSGEDLSHRLTKVESGIRSSSFLGIKGQEELGHGLKAMFNLESGVSADTGALSTSEFWGRTSEVGLAGGFGALTVGNSLSLSFRANLSNSPFTVFRSLGLTGATNFGAFQVNTVTYATPNHGGLEGVVQYGASEQPGQDAIYALQGNYARGRGAVGVTYTEGDGQSLWQWGGSCQIGPSRWFAQYGQANVYGTTNDRAHVHLGVSVPVSVNATVLAAWTHTTWQHQSQLDNVVVVYDHGLARRIFVYGGMIYHQRRDDGADARTGLSAFAGLRYRF